MIELVKFLNKVFGIMLAIATAFAAGWIGCSCWLWTAFRKDDCKRRKPNSVSYYRYRNRD